MTDPMLDTVIHAAHAAGEEIMRVYAAPFDVVRKDDQTPVTEADFASERVIVRLLTEAFPDIPIVSEETAPEDGFKPPAARHLCGERVGHGDPHRRRRRAGADHGARAAARRHRRHPQPQP
jgi:3'-phosphoadenosine 5'-phosphosulfate (PAPS) 3'-phosphatase